MDHLEESSTEKDRGLRSSLKEGSKASVRRSNMETVLKVTSRKGLRDGFESI